MQTRVDSTLANHYNCRKLAAAAPGPVHLMSLKQRIWTSVAVFGAMIVIGLAGVWHIVETAPRAQQESRTGQLGSGTAMLGSFILAAIWLPYAAQLGARRRAERDALGKSTTPRSR